MKSISADIVIVGGGPATLGFLCGIYKLNRLNELLSHESIAIVDAGTSFGGGTLGDYGINSNTSGDGFLSSIYKKRKDTSTTSLPTKDPSDSVKPDAIGRTKVREGIPLVPYKDLYNSPIANALKNFGKDPAPLQIVGHFLNYVGNHLLSYVSGNFK